MEIEDIIIIIMTIIAAYLFFSGLIRIIRRRATSTRWSYDGPYYAVRNQVESRGIGVVIGGIARIVIAGIIGFITLQLIQ